MTRVPTSLLLSMLVLVAVGCQATSDAVQPSTPLAPSSPRQSITTPAPSNAANAPDGNEQAVAAVGAVMLPNGVPLPVLRDNLDGSYLVQTLCGKSALARQVQPVAAVDVVIDPGHGGSQPGAVGPGGLAEKTSNLEVSRALPNALAKRGYTTLLTRTADYRLSLSTRGAFARTLRPRVFASVHFNAEPDETRATPGSETYHQHRSIESKRLAGLVYEEVFGSLAKHPGPWVGDFDAGVKPRLNKAGDDYYAMLRLTEGTPSVLIESAFISNPVEERLIGDPGVQSELAEAMARGIGRFLTTNDPGSGFVEPYPRDASLPSGRSDASCVDPDLGLEVVASDG